MMKEDRKERKWKKVRKKGEKKCILLQGRHHLEGQYVYKAVYYIARTLSEY